MSNSTDEPADRIQRILAYMVAGLVIVALGCFAAMLVGYATGAVATDPGPVWTTVVMLPYFALPAAFLLTIALIIMTAVRRARGNRSI